MKTLSTYTIGCEDELHEVAVTGSFQERGSGAVRVDNDVVFLNHDSDMMEAFVAFGARRPECMTLTQRLREVIDAYRQASTFWTGINWPMSTKGKVLQVNLENVTADEVIDLLREAEETEGERVRAAQDAVREAQAHVSAVSYDRDPQSLVVEEAKDELKRLRKVLTEEVALTEALVEGLEQLIEAEGDALKAAQFGRESFNAFLRKDFHSARALASNAERVETKAPMPLDLRYWRAYYNALSRLHNYVQFEADHRAVRGTP
jgi:hypothetical protein